MVTTYSMSGTKKWFYYLCQSRHNAEPNACVGSRVPSVDIERFIVERIEGIGRDPRVIACAIESSVEQARARIPLLEAERRRCVDEIRRLCGERDRFIEAIGSGAPAARVLGERVGTIDEQIADFERRSSAAQGELVSIQNVSLTEAEIRAALSAFHGIWSQLIAKERARVLSLLIDRIDYDGENGEFEVKFRPGGIRALGQGAGVEA